MHDRLTTISATGATHDACPKGLSPGDPPGGNGSDDERYRQLQEDHCCGRVPGKYELLWLVCLPCALFLGVVGWAAWRLLT